MMLWMMSKRKAIHQILRMRFLGGRRETLDIFICSIVIYITSTVGSCGWTFRINIESFWFEKRRWCNNCCTQQSRDIGSSLLQGGTFVYGILLSLLQFTFIAFGVLVYVLNEITLTAAVVLRILARHCEAGATLLESMPSAFPWSVCKIKNCHNKAMTIAMAD